jgi:hypothetical protein
MSYGFKQRSDIKRGTTDLFNVIDPGDQRLQAVYPVFVGRPVFIVLRRACQPERVYMIKNSFVIPSHIFTSSSSSSLL